MTALARAIATMEGFDKPGSRAARNRNPGNLRPANWVWLKGQTSRDPQGFAVFPDAETGWVALDQQIKRDAKRGHTLTSFLQKYAPPKDNDTENYIRFVCERLGVNRFAMLTEILQEKPK